MGQATYEWGGGAVYGRSMYLPFNFAVNLKPKSIKRNIGMRKILEMQTMIFPHSCPYN